MHKYILLIFTTLTMIVTGFGGNVSAKFPKNIVIHDKPVLHRDIAFADFDDKQLSLESFGRHIFVLYFFASWCGDCIKELEQLNDLQNKLKKEGLIVIPISEDYKTKGEVVDELKSKLNVALTYYFDKDNLLMKKLDVKTLPTSIILADDGDEMARIFARINWDDPYIYGTIVKYLDKLNEKR